MELATIVRNEIDERIRPAQAQNVLVANLRDKPNEMSQRQVSLNRNGSAGTVFALGVYGDRRYGQAYYGAEE